MPWQKKVISTCEISSGNVLQLQPEPTSEIHFRTTKIWLQVLSSQQTHMSGALKKKKKPSSHLLPGYSEDGGAQRGEVIPEHEFAEGPVCLDDENEFPPVGNQSNWPNLRCLEEGEIQADKNIFVFRTLCSPPSPLYPCWTRVKSRQGVTSSTVRNPQPSHILWRI